MKKKLGKYMEKSVLSMLLIVVLCIFVSCSSDTKSPQEANDSEIINAVVENFMLLAEVPRPSHHEEKISSFLMDWAEKQDLMPVQDSVKNVMFDVPATEGKENLPLVILQVHMDMVVAVEDGKEFDPLSDPITVIRNDKEGTLSADGTSLGADDGSGLAMVMAVVQGKMSHGPLRVIITVDEEDGMEGAFNMDASWLDGASYLINIDNEAADEVLVSTAAGDSVRARKTLSFVAPSGNMALNVEISNLKGGHSGVEINKGRLNGIIGLAGFLKQLDEDGIEYELASFEGGTAANAIPNKVNVVLVISADDKERIEQQLSTYCDLLNDRYKDIEDEIRYAVTESADLPQVITTEEKNNAIRFITEVIDGVNTWSSDMEGLVESSSNLGICQLNQNGLSIVTYIRSSAAEKETEILEAQMTLSQACGFEADSVKMADAWPYNPDSKLMALAQEVYKEQNGEDITISAVHAGLECGTFKKLKPDLDMISIGPDLKDVHTIKEVLYLNSISKTWNLLEGILERI